MNLAKETVEFYRTDGRNWPQDKTRHLIAVFNGGCPWKREYWLARNEQTPKIPLLGLRPALPILVAEASRPGPTARRAYETNLRQATPASSRNDLVLSQLA